MPPPRMKSVTPSLEFTIKMHNGCQTRAGSTESLEYVASQRTLYYLSRVSCIFAATRVTNLCTRRGRRHNVRPNSGAKSDNM
jgi:hypothetical protein